VIFGCITHLSHHGYLAVLPAESLQQEVGQCLQQLLWYWHWRQRSSASTEIEDELIEPLKFHSESPSP